MKKAFITQAFAVSLAFITPSTSFCAAKHPAAPARTIADVSEMWIHNATHQTITVLPYKSTCNLSEGKFELAPDQKSVVFNPSQSDSRAKSFYINGKLFNTETMPLKFHSGDTIAETAIAVLSQRATDDKKARRYDIVVEPSTVFDLLSLAPLNVYLKQTR